MSKPFAIFLRCGNYKFISQPCQCRPDGISKYRQVSRFLQATPKNRTPSSLARNRNSTFACVPLAPKRPEEINNRLYWREKCSILAAK